MKSKIVILVVSILMFISLCGNIMFYQKLEAKDDYGSIIGTYTYSEPNGANRFQLTIGHDDIYYIYRDNGTTARGTYKYLYENVYSLGNDSFIIAFKDKVYINELGNMFIANRISTVPVYNGNEKYAVDLLLDLYTSDYTRYLTYKNTNDLTPYITHYAEYATPECIEIMKRWHNLFVVADSYNFYENTKITGHSVNLTLEDENVSGVYLFSVTYSISDDYNLPTRTASGRISLSGRADNENKVFSISLFNQLDLIAKEYQKDREAIQAREKAVQDEMNKIAKEINGFPK